MSLDPNLPEYTIAIIPTVLIPLTMISVGISIVASFIAALFGVELKTEGPKRLLEVLLKPKVLLSALLFNLFVYGASKLYAYESARPRPLFYLKWKSKNQPSNIKYSDVTIGPNATPQFTSPQQFKAPKLDWKLKIKKGGFRPPIISSGKLFASSFDHHIYEIDFNSGKIERSLLVGAPSSTEPVILNNLLYIGEGVHETHHAKIYQFDLASGKLKNAFETLGHIEATPEISLFKNKTYLVTSSGKGGLYGITLPNMKLAWNTNIGHCDAPPLVESGVVYTSTGREKHSPDLFRSYAAALNLTTGEVKWKKELPVSSWFQPFSLDDEICFVVGELYFKMDYGGASCFKKSNGAYARHFRMDSPVISAPLITPSALIMASSNGTLCSWSQKTNHINWCKSFGKPNSFSYTNPVYDKFRGWLLYPFEKNIHILNPISGEVIASWKPSTGALPTYSSVMIQKNSWVLYSKEGLVTKYKTDLL